MHSRIVIAITLSCLLVLAPSANAFLEDVCQSREGGPGTLGYCIRPDCPPGFAPNRACPAQLHDFADIKPGRSLLHADSTYFIAQALGYRADVAYWIIGTVPAFMRSDIGFPFQNVQAGKKILNYDKTTETTVYYDALDAYLKDTQKTTGTLWKDPTPQPVPVQIARIGLYLHMLQDTSSHATYCGDDAPSPPGAGDVGTYMYLSDPATNTYTALFGNSCANSPHLAGHIQETGTGDMPLPLRDYVALNNTLDELIVFGNQVALKQPGWIVNPELLPPNLVDNNRQGFSAADLKKQLIGIIVKGTPYSRAEVYQSTGQFI